MAHDVNYFIAQTTGMLVVHAAHAEAAAEALVDRVQALEAELAKVKADLDAALRDRYTPPVRSPELVGSL